MSVNPLFHSTSPRKAGRPLGAKSQVVRDARSLRIHHFAFVRSSLASHLAFKGGTSLSKVDHVIDRFSEDIDLTCGPQRVMPHLRFSSNLA